MKTRNYSYIICLGFNVSYLLYKNYNMKNTFKILASKPYYFLNQLYKYNPPLFSTKKKKKRKRKKKGTTLHDVNRERVVVKVTINWVLKRDGER